MRVRVDRWLDFADRVGWSAVYAIAAALVVVFTEDGYDDWRTAAKFIGVSVGLAVVKVVAGQRTGPDDTGAVLPFANQAVVTPPPQAEPGQNTGTTGAGTTINR